MSIFGIKDATPDVSPVDVHPNVHLNVTFSHRNVIFLQQSGKGLGSDGDYCSHRRALQTHV